MNIHIVKYIDSKLELWNEFVKNAVFATIYHSRDFINYHPKDRFEDNSILIYNDETLICVMPCCKKGEKYFSYTGATYGGPVFLKDYVKLKYMKIIIDKIFEYYDNKIEFRIANDIYFEDSIYKLYYLLSQKNKIYLELSWYIKTNDDFIKNILHKRNKNSLIKSLKNTNIYCKVFEDDIDYENFYRILEKNLNINHNSKPTHSLEEFLKIKNILKDKQKLYLVKDKDKILGGVYVIKVTNQCWYTFYISRNIDLDKINMSVMYLMYTISNDAKNENIKYVDYGISTEDCGKLLNDGLSDFKESSLGGISNYRYLFL
jgi:hypothetical protein